MSYTEQMDKDHEAIIRDIFDVPKRRPRDRAGAVWRIVIDAATLCVLVLCLIRIVKSDAVIDQAVDLFGQYLEQQAEEARNGTRDSSLPTGP